MKLEKLLSHPSYRSVHFVAASKLPRDTMDLTDFVLLEFDAAAVATEQDLLRLIAGTFHFPSYFGGNWDALDECLRDLSWLPAKGYSLRVKSAEILWRSVPRAAGTLTELWLIAAEEWASEGIPFHLIFVWEA